MKISRRLSVSLASSAVILACAIAAPADSSNPPRPSSFYGGITVEGRSVPLGTAVSAWIGGQKVAQSQLIAEGGESLYRLHVPADDPATAGVEGGIAGQEIVFKVGSSVAEGSADWQDGTYRSLDLVAAAGPDLGVRLDDGRVEVSRGDVVDYVVEIENHGDDLATGVTPRFEIPRYCDFVSAGEGGAFAAGAVDWPASSLAAGASFERHVSIRVRRSAPLATTSLAARASFGVDSENGIDPEAANDSARDVDILTTPGALPNLTIAFDGLEVLPDRPAKNDSVEVRVTVRNVGAALANDPLVQIVAGDLEADGVVLGRLRLGDLEPGANRQVRVTWTALEGVTAISAAVDPDEELLESDRLDNGAERQVLIPRPQGPDLEVAVTTSTLAQSPLDLYLEGTVTLEVRNAGDAPAEQPFTLEIFDERGGDGRRDPNDLLLASRRLEPLGAGQSIALTLPLTASLRFRHPLLIAAVDSADEIAERDETDNLDAVFGSCPLPEAEDSLTPIEEWWATGMEVEVTPIVVQLSDDNGDGAIDSRDTPDVVIASEDATGRMIVALSGLDGSRLFTFRGSADTPLPFPAGQLAAADLDNDGVAEVVAPLQNGKLICLDHNGGVLWISSPVEGVGERWIGSIAVGDLDGDGRPELAVGRVVLGHDGQLLATGTGSGNRGVNYNYYGPFGSVLVPGATDYPHAVIADLDLDGKNELVAGDTVYRLAGNQLVVVWNSNQPDNLMRDGFVAVGNLDGDPQAEVVYVSSGQIVAYNHNGSTFAGRREISPIATATMPTFWGGPPTIADLDGDGLAEVLVATATEIVAMRSNLSPMWRRAIGPDFGAVHGLTAFDLDGDGDREVLYLDEHDFYIVDGRSGTILYQRPNTSKTATEYPVVADVDGDGRAEILLPSNTSFDGAATTRGLHVLGHPSWRGSRPIWNQYGYQASAVLADGTLPTPKSPPARAEATFRVNRDQAPPALYQPNLTLSLPRVGVPAAAGIPITLRIGNGGRGFALPGASLRIYLGDPATGAPVIDAKTTHGLRPGAYADETFYWPATFTAGMRVTARLDEPAAIAECREDDNEVAFPIEVSFLADLRFAPTAGFVLPSSAVAGQLATATVAVQNVGQASSAAASLGLFANADGSGPRLAQAPLPEIAAGAAASLTFTWDTLGQSAGAKTVFARLDDLAQVPESDETNNQASATITLTAPNRPDLSADALTDSPPAVVEGTPVTLTAFISNRGTAMTAASQALFTLNNVEIGRQPIPALAAGATFTTQVSFATLDRAGQLQGAVELDPARSLTEVSETNNRAVRNVTIAAGPIGLALRTDQLSYGANQDVLGQLTATNRTAATALFDLQVTIRDAFGAVFATVAATQPLSLPPGDTSLSFTWPTAASAPGPYTMMAELSEAGTVRKRAVASFTIAADLKAAVDVAPNRDRYEVGETVEVTLVVANASANVDLAGLKARTRIFPPGGAAAFDDTRAIAALNRGEATSFLLSWPVGSSAAGSWTIRSEVRTAAGLLIGYDDASFVIEDSSQTGGGLHGDLSLSPVATLGRGATLVADASLENSGNADFQGLAVRADLVENVSQAVVASDRQTLDLARSSSASLRFHFATASAPEGDYQVILFAEPPAGERRLDAEGTAIGRGLAIADAEIAEGDAGTRLLTFSVDLSSPATETVEVAVATVAGSATAGVDYLEASAVLSFAPGELHKTFEVTILGDLEAELPEVVLVRLADPVGALLADGEGVGTLLDEEGCASPSLLPGGSAEGEALTGFTPSGTAALRGGAPQPIDGQASFEVNGSLERTIDLSAFAAQIDGGGQRFGLLAFAAGASSAVTAEFLDAAGVLLDQASVAGGAGSWQVLHLEREAPAGSRQLRLRLQGAGSYFDRVELRSLGVRNLSLTGLARAEGNAGITTVELPLALSCPAAADLTVELASEDVSATAGSDYRPLAAATVTFPAGATAATATLEIFGDTTDEEDESFRVLATPLADLVILGAATVTALDDDGPATLAVGDIMVTEGDAGGGSQATFEVTLLAISGRRVEVSYATQPGSAGSADFGAVAGRLVFPPGTTTQTVAVPILGDQLDEDDETFFLHLSAPSQATLGDPQGEATLVDDDEARLSIGNAEAFEGDSTAAVLTFKVRLSLPSSRQVTVAYATADGTALAGSDYQAAAGTLTFPPGTLERTLEVRSIPDLVKEGNETFLVLLGEPTGAGLALPEGQATLADDDGMLFAIADLVVAEPAAATVSAQVEISLNKAVSQAVAIEIATRDGTALAGLDYDALTTLVTLPAGASKVKANIPIRADALAELVETFTVELRNPPAGAAILDPEAQVSIVDEDLWHLNGQASSVVFPGCVRLVPDVGGVNGTAWRKAKIDLGQNFDKTFKVYLGSRDSGADGLVFTLQNQGATALGGIGQSIGYGGITPSVGIEVDTWDNGEGPADHLAIGLNGSVFHNGMASVQASASSADVEDGLEHDLRVVWNAETRQTQVLFDGVHRLVYEKELVSSIFANSAQVFYGFTSGTGSAANVHYFCETELCAAGATPKVSIGNAFLTEGTGATKEASFTLTLSCPAAHPVTVDWTTRDGDALAGEDYLAASGQVTFAAGQTSANIHVTVVGDSRPEVVETFEVELVAIAGAPLRYTLGKAEITDDDLGWSVSGDASSSAIPSCIQLTPAASNRRGSAWNLQKADLAGSFDRTFEVYLGNNDGGADGIAFAFQNAGASALGTNGPGLGIGGVTPSLAAEVDTWNGASYDLAEDHIAIFLKGDFALPVLPAVPASASSGNVEDGQRHRLRVLWNGAAKQTTVYFDGFQRMVYDRDLVAAEFAGQSQVFWGFTGSTGGASNLQYFCPLTTCSGSDPNPWLAIGDLALYEGNAGNPVASVPVTLSCATDHPVTVSFATANGEAIAGADFTATAGTLTFLPGEISKAITVPVVADSVIEPTERFFVDLAAPSGARVLHPRSAVTLLTDDLGVTLRGATLVEGDPVGSLKRRYVLTAELSMPLAGPVRIIYATASGTATSGVDFVALNSFVDLPAGATGFKVDIDVSPDLVKEADERFFLDLSAGGGFFNLRLPIDLLDDDDNPTGHLLKNPSAEQVTSGKPADWTEAAGTTWTSHIGFPHSYHAASFFNAGQSAAGELRQDADVSRFAAYIDSGLLSFEFYGVVRSNAETPADTARTIVEYRDAAGQVLATADSGEIANVTAWQMVGDRRVAPAGTRTIRVRLLATRNNPNSAANDAFFDDLVLRALGVPTFSIADAEVLEGETGSREAVMTVKLSSASSLETRVGYFTADGTATAGSDYQAAQGTLVFPPGTVSKEIRITVFGDGLSEPNETLLVHLGEPVNAAVDRSPATLTLVQDERMLSMAAMQVKEGDAGQTMVTLTAKLSSTSTLPVYWNWQTAEVGETDAATSGADFVAAGGTLEIPAGALQATIQVPILGDQLGEADEILTIVLSGSVNATANQATAQVKIFDDDLALSVEDVNATEGNHGERLKLDFQIKLARAATFPVSVSYATASLTAESGVDFEPATGSVTFAVGETRKTVPVTLLGDVEPETSETLILRLHSPANGRIGRGEGFGTIVDDDGCLGPQLVRSGGFEFNGPLYDWQGISGTLSVSRGDNAQFGDAYLYCNSTILTGDTYEARQDVPLADVAGLIDGGAQQVAIEAFTKSKVEAVPDTARLIVEFLDAAKTTQLGVWQSDELASVGVWRLLAGRPLIPPGTRFARLRLTGKRNTGNSADVYFDSVRLGLLGSPLLYFYGGPRQEGDSGQSDLPFFVQLSCGQTTPVTASYTTVAGGTATAGVDYLPTTGSVTFAPGEILKKAMVPVLGDTATEVDETVMATLNGAIGATIVDGTATGKIYNDELLANQALLIGTVRDLDDRHPDFENTRLNTPEANIVKVLLGSDGKPEFNPAVPHLTVVSAASFHSWFHDVPGVNAAAELPLILTKNGNNYTFGSSAFFPIEDQLLGNPLYANNLHFTYEIHSRIQYRGGETFNFTGDDDIWLFINGRLAIDLGGIHGPQGQTVALDNLRVSHGLTVGGSYAFDLFFAERHTTGSNFNISTNLPLDLIVPGRLEFAAPEFEAGEAGPVATIRVRRVGGADGAVSVDYRSVAGGSAAAGLDYTPVAGTVTFASGDSAEKTFTIPILNDLHYESPETVALELASPTGNAELGLRQATLRILDDEKPALSLRKRDLASPVRPGDTLGYQLVLRNDGPAPATQVVLRDPLPAGTTLVAGSVSASAGTVTGSAPLTVTIPQLAAGAEATVTFEVAIGLVLPAGTTALANQASAECAEVATPVASDDPDTPAEGDATVTDLLLTSGLSVDDRELAEGDQGTSTMTFTVRLDHAAGQEVTVAYQTVAGTAAAGLDFVTASGTVVFAPGQISRTVAVEIAGDLLFEADETFELVLSDPLGAELADGVGEGVIRDDEACEGPNLLENPGAEAALFSSLTPGWTAAQGAWKVRRSQPLPFAGQAYFHAGALEEAELAQDVDLSSYAAAIDAGGQEFVLRGRVRVGLDSSPAIARIAVEFWNADKTVLLASWQSDSPAAGSWVSAEEVGEAPAGARFARVRLLSSSFTSGANDAFFDGLELRSLGVPVVTIDDVVVAEKAGRPAPFTLALSCPLEGSATALAATVAGTALAGSDFVATAGSRTFAPGELRAPFWVPIVVDAIAEPSETFKAELAAPSAIPAAILLDREGQATILDDQDAAPHAMVCEDAYFDALPAGFTLSALGDAAQADAQAAGGQLLLQGTGSQLYHGPDHTVFYWREASGDFRIEIDIAGLAAGGNAYRKAGLMLRGANDPQAARVMIEYVPDFPGSPALQFDVRTTAGGVPVELASTQTAIQLPVRVAMIRRGSRITILMSRDGGLNWTQPLGAKGGTVDVPLADPVLVGANVTSYDPAVPKTAAFDRFRLCRPAAIPVPPPAPCDDRPIDLVYLVDLSGSMKRPHGATAGNSRLDSVRDTLLQVQQGLAARGDGSRSALIVASGNGVAPNNLANGARLTAGFTAGAAAVANALGQLDDPGIVEQASSPAAIALDKVLQVLVAQRDPNHRVVLLWATDNLGNIDAAGRGPRFYTDAELQAIAIADGQGGFVGPERVLFQGNFNPTIFAYDGQAVADAMQATSRLLETVPLRVVGLVPRGDGSPDRPILREDLLEWMVQQSGGAVFGASDRSSLIGLAPSLLEAAACVPQP